MFLKRAAAAAIIVAGLTAGAAVAQEVAAPTMQLACVPPGQPPLQSLRPRGPVLPAKPPCAGANGSVGRCGRKDVDRYNLAIDAFNRDMDAYNRASQSYADALRNWVRAVGDYQDCEIDQMNKDVARINASR